MEHEFDEEAFNELNMYMTSYNKEIQAKNKEGIKIIDSFITELQERIEHYNKVIGLLEVGKKECKKQRCMAVKEELILMFVALVEQQIHDLKLSNDILNMVELFKTEYKVSKKGCYTAEIGNKKYNF